jgi:hypothetical protein
VLRIVRRAKKSWRYSDRSEFPYRPSTAADEAALPLVRFYIRHLPPVRLTGLQISSESQEQRDSNFSFAPDWYACQYNRGTDLAVFPVRDPKLCFGVLFRKNAR